MQRAASSDIRRSGESSRAAATKPARPPRLSWRARARQLRRRLASHQHDVLAAHAREDGLKHAAEWKREAVIDPDVAGREFAASAAPELVRERRQVADRVAVSELHDL